jgi:membrane-associated phospholipid phosphatase
MRSADWRHRLELRPLLSDHPIAMRVALVLWVFGGTLFLALAIPALASIVQSVDDVVYELAVDLELGVVEAGALGLHFLGSTWVTVPVILGVGVYLAFRKRWAGLTFWTLAMVFSQLLIGPMKLWYARPRPPLPLVETTSFSFPSGHAVAGAAIAISLVIVLVPAGPRRRNLELLAALFAITMGLSRVYLRAHWLSDVVAGVSMGAAVAIGTAVAMHYLVAWDGKSSGPEADRMDQDSPTA